MLLTGAQGAGWIDAVARLATDAQPALVAHMVGGGGQFSDPEGTWRTLYTVEPDGAILVRPDGYVGWRSQGLVVNPACVLTQVLDSVLSLH